LRRPVAARTHAVDLAGDHDGRHALGDVAAAGVVDALDLAVGEVGRVAALGAGGDLVLEPDVRERAAGHDPVVAAARAVGVEVLLLDAALDEVLPGGAVHGDRAG